MGWYEAIKDGISVAQQADNIPLVQNLIDAQKQILDLIEENQSLKTENQELTKKLHQKESIERHNDTYITLKPDSQQIRYCATCWDNNQKLIQLSCDTGEYRCPVCGNHGYYDKAEYDRWIQKQMNEYDSTSYPTFI